jgi:hypothetical protein
MSRGVWRMTATVLNPKRTSLWRWQSLALLWLKLLLPKN